MRLLALAFVFAALVGCGGTPRNAEALRTADEAIEATTIILSEPEVVATTAAPVPAFDQQQAEFLNLWIGEALSVLNGAQQLIQPPITILDPKGEVEPIMTAAEIVQYPDSFEQVVPQIVQAATEEAESRTFWTGLLDLGLKAFGGAMGLGLFGGGSGLVAMAGVALGARKWMKRGQEAAHALGFGDVAEKWIMHPKVPQEIKDAWNADKRVLVAKQQADGIQGSLMKRKAKAMDQIFGQSADRPEGKIKARQDQMKAQADGPPPEQTPPT